MSHSPSHHSVDYPRDEDEYVRADEVAEEIDIDPNGDPMEDYSGDEDGGTYSDDAMDEEIQLQNDSVAYFDKHQDSIFSIAAHPTEPNLIVTGGGDDVAYVFDITGRREEKAGDGEEDFGDNGIIPVAKLEKHTDSVIDVAFSIPDGQFIITAGMDGRVAVWSRTAGEKGSPTYIFSADISEVQEVIWLSPCPDGNKHPNTFAFGSSDGSVWVYRISGEEGGIWLEQVASYFAPEEAGSTAGVWSPKSAGASLLATVSEDSRLFVYDPFGDLAAKGVVPPNGQQALYASDSADDRFRVEGGLYSVAISPSNAVCAVGGAEGQIRVVSLPRPNSAGGAILASLAVQSDSVETLAFAPAPPKNSNVPSIPLLAAGSVDGSIAVFDPSRSYALRRHIVDAHADGNGPQAVISIKFSTPTKDAPAQLTTCGNDGVVRRWDLRGGNAPTSNVGAGAVAGAGIPPTTATGVAAPSSTSGAVSLTTTTRASNPPIGEWKGHRGGGEGGGVLGFVMGVPTESPGSVMQSDESSKGPSEGGWIVTAGDDNVSLVFLT